MKRALLIVIYYTGTDNQLSGCVNDILDMYNVCINSGYTYFNVLCDEEIAISKYIYKPIALPTKKNIIDYIVQFINTALPRDTLFIHYSGHGTQSASKYESDGQNEALVPLDYLDSDIITDNELRKMIIEPLLYKNIKLRVILDCCHSGTGLDLKNNLYIKDRSINNEEIKTETIQEKSVCHILVQEQIKNELYKYFDNNIVDEHIKNVDTLEKDILATLIKRITNEQMMGELYKLFDKNIVDKLNYPKTENDDENIELVAWSNDQDKKTISYKELFNKSTTPSKNKILLDVLMLSGCDDHQTSADAYFNNRANGALTKMFIEIYKYYMARGNIENVGQFLYKLRNTLRLKKYSQVPQMSSENSFYSDSIFDI